MPEPLIFEKGSPGRRGFVAPPADVPERALAEMFPAAHLRSNPPALPEAAEIDVVRHYTKLSHENYGVDQGFYPLGSCTMKYNPKINEEMSRLPGFSALHPLRPEKTVQGALRLMFELESLLKEISGMARVSLQPAAGAQGELVGMLIVRAYHKARGKARRTVIIPDSAHGTNPASATLAGYAVRQVRSTPDGLIDVDELRQAADDDTAALMLTNPNTLGLFEREIAEIARVIHAVGGLLYLDGANMNALLGRIRPGDMGFDIVHFNLHKTFSTPHGGGGPGAGSVGVTEELAPFLPSPTVEKGGDGYYWDDKRPQSIGRVHAFNGNFGILVRAYTYIRALGRDGLRHVSENAILGANYVRKRLEPYYPIPHNRVCMHEFVISAKPFREKGIHAWDIAKRLIDYGIYPPTVSFPNIVDEAIMIETPETESKEVLDLFCDAMIAIRREIDESPQLVKNAPSTRQISRLDEVRAARQPDLRWNPPT